MLDMAAAVKAREAYVEEVRVVCRSGHIATASTKGCIGAGTVQTCLMACG